MLLYLQALLFLLIFKLLLAGKDATSYLLKDKKAQGEITTKRVNRWHRDGAIIDFLYTLALSNDFKDDWWQIFIISLLLRLSVYDLAFNHWAKLDIGYIGGTAGTDKFFVKIFDEDGAVTKSIFFFAIFILFMLSKTIFHF